MVGETPLTTQEWVLLAIVLTVWLVIIIATVIAVLRAAALPPPTLLVVVLAILTLVTLAAFVVTRQQELATLAGTGFGALAGAVAAVWTRPRGPEEEKVRTLTQATTEPDGL